MFTIDSVYKSYRSGGFFSGKRHSVLSDISFQWAPGECLGIIGESGSGKSTLGRLLLGIQKPDAGSILWNGKAITDRKNRSGVISAVFQDYTSSINPFYTVEKALLEPLLHTGKSGKPPYPILDTLLEQVGLESSYRSKYPHELSGGEAQRVCIARALSTEPQCILFDEAISSLDGSVQMQILELLKGLASKRRMGFIFITHDIGAAAYLCSRLMIMQSGEIKEIVDTDQLRSVKTAYAKKLLNGVIL
ncbi:ABC transporter ATP-binding protein [Paenibacillus sp. CAU 1782]